MVSHFLEKKNCIFYRTKIDRTLLKQPIRIEHLIKQKQRGALAEKQVPGKTSYDHGHSVRNIRAVLP